MGRTKTLRGRALIAAAVLAGALLVAGVPAAASPHTSGQANDPPSGAYRPGVLVVGYKTGTSDTTKDSQQRRRGSSKREKRLKAINVDVVQLPAGTDVAAAAAAYKQDGEVAFAEPDFVAHADVLAPNDTRYSQQYGPQKVKAVEAHDALYPGGYSPALTGGNPTAITGPLIAVIDTGIAANPADPAANPDLVHKVLAVAADCTLTPTGTAAPCPTSSPFDDQGHGTHVAGIAAAETNNTTGVVGIAPRAQVVSIKALDANGSGYYSWIASSVLCATDLARCGLAPSGHADVINMSLGGSASSTMLNSAITTARTAGVVVVAAAGNSGSQNLSYPGAYADLSVIATDQNDVRPSWSNFGGYANQVSAPGLSILSTVSTNPALGISNPSGYATLSGTSMATPHVSGLAALLTGVVPAGGIVDRIKQTADRLPSAGSPDALHYGAGRINALNAVKGTINPAPTADFSLSASPSSKSVQRKSNAVYTLTINRINGFGSAVNLSVSGLPSNSTPVFTPSSTTGTTSTFKVKTTRSTPRGTYTLTLTASGGSLTRTTTVKLTVT